MFIYTVPVGVSIAEVTVTVKVTGDPFCEGFWDDTIVVVVGACTAMDKVFDTLGS
jgi:hypothetical protein